MGVVITVLMGIWAAVMFIAAENKEEIWSRIKFKDEVEK